MKALRAIAVLALVCGGPGPGAAGQGAGPAARGLQLVRGKDLRCGIDPKSGAASALAGQAGGREREWLTGPVRLTVRNEVRGAAAEPAGAKVARSAGGAVTVTRRFPKAGLTVAERWSATPGGLAWDLAFTRTGPRVGHEIVVDLPVLRPDSRIFTPSERGVMALAGQEAYKPAPYASLGWGSGRCYVLPLVSVFDDRSDAALTIALPPDRNIPHLQVEWPRGKVLRLRLAHRGMGGAEATTLRLLLYSHRADYRSALKAYSDDFPAYFKPPLPRGKYEGTFWYHHIQDHPDPAEMARQHVRYMWASFWFTHLGEYLPAEKEWEPYTYARWWKLGKKIGDAQILAFVRKMHQQGMGTFAYFNVTEYGGAGGKGGDAAEANRRLRERFANALFKGPDGKPVPTWEGSMAMNPGRDYALRPFLREQVRRHLERLGTIDGFVIDRLDWASRYDYGHDDGLTRLGARPAENMALPVADAVQEVCKLAHQAGKRVYVNQFYRVEVLRDVDGYCHENDYVRGLGYLSPYRPASAWHHRTGYKGDLLPFEAQLKRRLQFALFPQMIAHTFPISQQGPDPRAADLLEVYAPLFDTLLGKEQVLGPHCVAATGANDVNLFVNGAGHYVVPVTSRVRFLSRAGGDPEAVTVTIRTPRAGELQWAHALSADGKASRAPLTARPGEAEITLERHGTCSVVVAGRGAEPALPQPGAEAKARERLFPNRRPPVPAKADRPDLPGVVAGSVILRGRHVGEPGRVAVFVGDKEIGQAVEGACRLPLASGPVALPAQPGELTLGTGDEGVWFVPEEASLVVHCADGKSYAAAEWHPGAGAAWSARTGRLRLRLAWRKPVEIVRSKARFAGRDVKTRGNWPGAFGRGAAWIPKVVETSKPGGYALRVTSGRAFTWAPATSDSRVLGRPKAPATARPSTCWFEDKAVVLSVTPPDRKPYRLTVYLLDYDRNGRAMTIRLRDDAGMLDAQQATIKDTDGGVYLSWTVTGAVTVEAARQAGFNAVLSGVFVDPT